MKNINEMNVRELQNAITAAVMANDYATAKTFADELERRKNADTEHAKRATALGKLSDTVQRQIVAAIKSNGLTGETFTLSVSVTNGAVTVKTGGTGSGRAGANSNRSKSGSVVRVSGHGHKCNTAMDWARAYIDANVKPKNGVYTVNGKTFRKIRNQITPVVASDTTRPTTLDAAKFIRHAITSGAIPSGVTITRSNDTGTTDEKY